MTAGFKGIEGYLTDHAEWIKRAARVINGHHTGKLNAVKLVTLDANATSTLVEDARIGAETAIILAPTTANAAAAIATTYVSETGRVNEAVTISHANNGQTDRTFRMVMIG